MMAPSLYANMAEGGGEDDQSNPFSFKTYVKKKTRQQGEQDVATDDIFAITGATGSTRKKEKQSLVVAEDDGDTQSVQPTKTKKKGNKDNPFSFKKFLGQSGQKENPTLQQRNISHDVRTNGSAPTGLSACSPCDALSSSRGPSSAAQHSVAPPDFASHLPDFIQNHFSDDTSRQEHERRQLPDFTLQSGQTQNNCKERDMTSESFFRANKEESLVDNTFCNEDEDDIGTQRGRQLSLPDFLVDSAVAGTQSGEEDNKALVNVRSQGGSLRSRLPELPPLDDQAAGGTAQNDVKALPDDTVLRQLQEENRQLKATIAQMRQRASDEEARIGVLEKEISRLRKKEAEETAVMERAVQQVEENLVATTTRAVQAETLASKLKQDVKTLQGQVKTLTAENQALRSGDKGLSDIRERTKYASEQLATAAATAETNLKELLGGVEKLKLLGQVLSSLEKVTDADASPTHDSSSRSSPS